MENKITGSEKTLVIKLPLEDTMGQHYSTFKLENAVCNHGFFMMAPNRWDASTKTLYRPLRLSDLTTCVNVSISQSPTQHFLLLLVDKIYGRNMSLDDQTDIQGQVKRMLRISDRDERIVNEFQNMHHTAKQRGFGRLFRSPTFFEDLVKVILLCNCGWKRSLEMAESLCELESKLRIKENGKNATSNLSFPPIVSCFPSPKDLASFDESSLSKYCNLGYRAKYILNLVKHVQSGTLRLDIIEQNLDYETYDSLWKKFRKIRGFGTFSCTNALMCLGFYDKIPWDSETVRHMKEVNGKKHCSKTTIDDDLEDIYGCYGKYRCLAYWLELLEGYEKKVGKLCDLPTSKYYMVTGSLVEECESNK